MGSIQVSHVGWRLPGGAELLRDVSFRVGDGERVALVGANGVGKSTLLRIDRRRAHRRRPGPSAIDGRLGVMRQLVGTADADRRAAPCASCSCRSPRRAPPRAPRLRLGRAERHAGDDPMRYADGARRLGRRRRLRRRGALGRVRAPGPSALDLRRRSPTARCARSPAASRSASPSRCCCAATTTCCCSTSPTTSSTCPAKRWLERELARVRKTMLFVSHDRELLAATATKVVTVEAERARGRTAAASPATPRPARRRLDTLDQRPRRWYEDERKRLEELVAEMRRRAKISATRSPRS